MRGLILSLLFLAGCTTSETTSTTTDTTTPPANDSEPLVNPGGKSEQNFIVRRDGFSFENYGNEHNPRNLTVANLERLCGPEACARGTSDSCVPTAAMRTFQDIVNRDMANGHCDGMAVLAQAIFVDNVSLQSLDVNALTTFALPLNAKVQSEIAFFSSTQLTDPAALAELRNLTPNQVLDILRNPGFESYTIGLYQPDFSDGHSVTAIRVIDDNRTGARIKIYDNNYPGDEDRFINVNKGTNTWRYDIYSGGNAQNKTLTLIPLKPRLDEQECVGVGSWDAFPSRSSPWRALLEGEGDLEVPIDTQNILRRTDARLSLDSPEPLYVLAPGNYHLRVLGTRLKERTKTSLSIFGPGHAFSIEGIILDPMQIDDVTLGENGSSLGYSTSDAENVTIRIGATYVGADYELRIFPVAGPNGFEVDIENVIDTQLGSHVLVLRIRSHDGSDASFGLQMTRIADKADETFTHLETEGTSLGANETVYLRYGSWSQDGDPVLLDRDANSDGIIDSTQSLNDEI